MSSARVSLSLFPYLPISQVLSVAAKEILHRTGGKEKKKTITLTQARARARRAAFACGKHLTQFAKHSSGDFRLPTRAHSLAFYHDFFYLVKTFFNGHRARSNSDSLDRSWVFFRISLSLSASRNEQKLKRSEGGHGDSHDTPTCFLISNHQQPGFGMKSFHRVAKRDQRREVR